MGRIFLCTQKKWVGWNIRWESKWVGYFSKWVGYYPISDRYFKPCVCLFCFIISFRNNEHFRQQTEVPWQNKNKLLERFYAVMKFVIKGGIIMYITNWRARDGRNVFLYCIVIAFVYLLNVSVLGDIIDLFFVGEFQLTFVTVFVTCFDSYFR